MRWRWLATVTCDTPSWSDNLRSARAYTRIRVDSLTQSIGIHLPRALGRPDRALSLSLWGSCALHWNAWTRTNLALLAYLPHLHLPLRIFSWQLQQLCSFVVLFPVVTQKYANFRFLALHFDTVAKFELWVSTTFFVFWTRPWGTSKHRTYSCYITLLGRLGNEDEKFRPKKARELS